VRPIPFPGEPLNDVDRSIVAVQIGRAPRGAQAVSARCVYSLPVVVRTAPVLEDGTPFPTMFYLTCPVAVRAVGRLEAHGRMRALNEDLANDEDLRAAYTQAHERYLALRGPAGPNEGVTAGGMPTRVKCLHALYAHELADANPIGAVVREEIEPVDCPGPCVTDGERTPGHPGFTGKR
jgi:uncharacterized protein